MTTDLRPVLDADAMRAADAATISDWGVPGRVLMETAGRAVADAVEALAGPLAGRDVVVLAGRGNNGGDGWVAARVLHARGARVHVAFAPGDSPPDAAANRALAERLADDDLTMAPFDAAAARAWRPAVVIDALLGVGAGGPLRPPLDAMAAWANRQSAPVLAVDLPSGLDATTGEAADGAVRADATLTLGALKSGLLVGHGPALAGRVRVADIGLVPAEVAARAVAHRITRAWAGAHLPERAPDAHKYSAGRALCVVGSRAYSGAAVLASGAAARAGAGSVVTATPASVAPVVDAHLAAVVADALPETDGGTLAITGYDRLVERADAADAVLVGCGLGRVTETGRLVQALLRRLVAAGRPTVLDADALRAIRSDRLAERDGDAPLVLTPHLGELRALVGDDGWASADRIGAVRELAMTWRATVVWKGMPTVVGRPDGGVHVGPPPAPALATAGAGDVLAGAIVGLLAQGVAPDVAPGLALAIGTEAVRVAARRRGEHGLVAPDFVSAIPSATRRLQRAAARA